MLAVWSQFWFSIALKFGHFMGFFGGLKRIKVQEDTLNGRQIFKSPERRSLQILKTSLSVQSQLPLQCTFASNSGPRLPSLCANLVFVCFEGECDCVPDLCPTNL